MLSSKLVQSVTVCTFSSYSSTLRLNGRPTHGRSTQHFRRWSIVTSVSHTSFWDVGCRTSQPPRTIPWHFRGRYGLNLCTNIQELSKRSHARLVRYGSHSFSIPSSHPETTHGSTSISSTSTCVHRHSGPPRGTLRRTSFRRRPVPAIPKRVSTVGFQS